MLTTAIFSDGAIGLCHGVMTIVFVWWLSSKLTRKIG